LIEVGRPFSGLTDNAQCAPDVSSLFMSEPSALSLLVGLEKLVPLGFWLSSVTDAALAVWGAWLIAGSFI
jgi:hypothetical protein